MTNEEIKEMVERAGKKVLEKLRTNPDEMFDLNATLDKYNQVLKEKIELQENYERIYNENCILREKHNITDISLLDENYNLQQEIDRLNNIIDELAEWLEKTYQDEALNKLKELKGDN